MADIELERRLASLELRVLTLPGLTGTRANDGDTNGCTNCDTNGCTNCRANDMLNVLLPGVDRALTSREIASIVSKAQG